MSEPERKPDIRERLGGAFNASSLKIGLHTAETSLTLVAAQGAAALHIHHGADRSSATLAEVVANPAHQVKPENALAAELAQDLAHIRYGRQYARLERAILLFACWMEHRHQFAAIENRRVILLAFSRRVMHEWLSDHCPRCGGSGRLELLANGTLVRGRGRGQRNAIFRDCPQKGGCGGTGKPVPSHPARRKALGIDAARYDKEGWGRLFVLATKWLDRDLGRLTRPLTAQLERSIKRA